jgi:transposase-like protein
MSDADLTAPQFTNEAAAVAHVEASRWPKGEYHCPLCGSLNVHRLRGTQAGYFQCNDCLDKYTCRTGTVMERSHIPVHKWLLAIHLLSCSKKGMSSHQLHRMLGVTYKSAWFLSHRIREAMKDGAPVPMGGAGGQVQADETYYGNTSKRSKRRKKGYMRKEVVLALVDPATGVARAFHLDQGGSAAGIREILVTNASRASTLVSDESALYTKTGQEFSAHETVWHAANEYVNKAGFTTNNVENFFNVFKRGMRGVYHFCGEQHLQRYLTEFAFRYSHRSGVGVSDRQRAAKTLKGIEGRRLTYRRPDYPLGVPF